MKLHNRQVKASFWNDSLLARNLSRDGRFFYQGTFQLADDSGCLEDDPYAYKMMIFPAPADEDITESVLAEFRDKLIELGKLIPYEVDGQKYLFLKNFHKHQTIKNPDAPTMPLPPWIKWETYPSNPRAGKYIVSDYKNFINKAGLQSSYDFLTDNLQSSYENLQSSSNLKPLTFNLINNNDNNTCVREDEFKDEEFEGINPTESKAVIHYNQNIGPISSSIHDQMQSFIADGIEEDLIIKAIDAACEQNVPKWVYIMPILQDCVNRGIKTAAQFDAKEVEFQSKKKTAAGHSPPNQMADDNTCIAVLGHLNAKAITAYKSSNEIRLLIGARVADGFSIEDFKAVIDKKVTEWKGTEMEQYIRPETLFGDKFQSYLNQKVIKPKPKNGIPQNNFDQREFEDDYYSSFYKNMGSG